MHARSDFFLGLQASENLDSRQCKDSRDGVAMKEM